MQKHQEQKAEASFQCMGWELLKEITRHVGTTDKGNWRLVCKATLQEVHDSATSLAPCKNVPASATALLPQLAAKCSGLKQLSFKNLRHLHSISGLLQLPLRLEALDISHTDVTDLSPIASCTSLKRLTAERVRGCWGRESRQLAAVLKQLPGLTALKLNDNKLCVGAARDVAAVLQNLTDFEELDIAWTDAVAAAALLPAFPQPKGLRLLNLRYCRLGGQVLLPAILQLTRLQQLNLSGNALRADGAVILAPALRKLTQLEDLDLFDNNMGDDGIAALAPAIQQLTGLKALDLGANGFGLSGAKALAPALRHLTTLKHLDLFSNDFGPQGAALLAPAIQELTGLLRLQLSSIALGAEGMAALAPALQRLTTLRHLNLYNNALGPDGLQALLPGIQQLVSLRSLFLQNNGLGRMDTFVFAAGIHQLTRLEELVLGDDVLEDDDFEEALAHMIHTSSPGCKVSCRY